MPTTRSSGVQLICSWSGSRAPVQGAPWPEVDSKKLEDGPCRYRYRCRHTHIDTGIVDWKKLEYGPGTICAAFSASLGFGVRGQSHSNFLASTVPGGSG